MSHSDSRPSRDVSEHPAVQNVDDREAEEALRERERLLDSLMGVLPGSAYRALADEHWNVLFVSKGIEEVTGYPPEEFTSRRLNYNDLMLPEDRAATREAVLTALRERRMYDVEHRIRHKDGSVRWIWSRGQGCFPRTGPSASSRWWNPDSQLLRQQAGNSVLCSGSRGDRKLPGAMLFRIKTRVLMLPATCR